MKRTFVLHTGATFVEVPGIITLDPLAGDALYVISELVLGAPNEQRSPFPY
jgi:hypothetical protein